MRYDLQTPAVSETISFTCMVQAHSENVRYPPPPARAYLYTLTGRAGFDVYRDRDSGNRWPSSRNIRRNPRFVPAQVLARNGRYARLGGIRYIIRILQHWDPDHTPWSRFIQQSYLSLGGREDSIQVEHGRVGGVWR